MIFSAVPSYVLLLLQEMELRQPVDIAAASYGKLYRASLTSSLAKKGFDVESALSYLTELAYAFFSQRTDVFDDQQAVDWHQVYVNEYKIALEYESSRDRLVGAGLLSYQNGMVRFKVKAAFYFFLATTFPSIKTRKLARCHQDLDSETISRRRCKRHPFPLPHRSDTASHRRDSSERNQNIDGEKETDLMSDLEFTGDLVARLKQPSLRTVTLRKRRQLKLESQDSLARDDDPSDDMYQYKREDELTSIPRTAATLHRSMRRSKTIQIQGQIVRSFAGSLKGTGRSNWLSPVTVFPFDF